MNAGAGVADTAAAIFAESIAPAAVRFHADARAAALSPPSLVLERPRPGLGPPPRGWRIVPTFESRRGGRIARVAIEPGTSLYGTGETAGPLLRDGRTITCWNTDAYAYDDRTPSLYQSHPWVLAVRADGSAFGVLADTPGKVVIDLDRKIEFRALGASFPVIAIEGDSPAAVLRALADLTGRMPLPPRWALGYQQCRFSYAPAAEARRVAREFRQRRIPCDVLWLDIDSMDGYRSFTFDPQGFRDPKALNDSLHAQGFHAVWMLDPGLMIDEGYFAWREGTLGDHWVESAAGTPWSGTVWPGRCVWPDFTREATRAWWAGLVRDFVAHGVDGLWNDMNEPSVFDGPGKTMATDVRHRADAALGGAASHERYHNVYGMLMARSTREGLLLARPERRPFVLSRANFLGGHRYAAAWTGDNAADWNHLRWSVSMALNLGLSGQPFAGPDLGGYKGPGTPSLFARWMGIGAFLPFARAHTEKGNPPKEPWAFGRATEETCRRALEARYRLMPYLYTVFREASVSGLPVVRPVFFADPADPSLRSEDGAFLLGGDVLVVADVTPLRNRRPSLPEDGAWPEIALLGRRPDGSRDPDLPRLLQRPGSIVPLGPVVQHTGEIPAEASELAVLVSFDPEGRAVGYLYEDEGDGFGYERGEYRLTRFDAERSVAGSGRGVVVRATQVEGGWPKRERVVRVVAE
jgi:alpha-glucosidase